MIDNVQSKTAAVSKNVGKDKRTLDQKVIDIVASANKMALPDRQVVPRNALIVMQRAMNELASLPDESKEAGVLREVNKFISLNQNTFSSIDTYGKHTDLLPAGHPLSDHNSSLSTEDYLQRYASWLSADPGISDDVRHLVAAAYSQVPGSLEREHAFIRLSTIKASSLPAYFKIDIPALVAAFSFGDGNSSAARRARVALQWRDRLGRWVEMGRGINFKFRLPDGGIATAAGTYVGSDANAGYSGNWARKEANNGLVEVTGSSDIPDGIYSIRNNNAEVYKARLSEEELERAGVETDKSSRYRLSSQFDESIPDLNDLLATKVDGPSGWTKNEDGSFTSDDDYKVIKKDDGYEVYRLDPEGKTGDKVGDAKTWADVQNVAVADEEAYDKYKEDVESGQLPLGDGERPEPRYSRMNRDVQREIKQLRDQIPQNQESNQRIESQLERALSGKDSQGRDLPEGWYSEIDPSQISETYYKDIPGATRNDEYLVAVVGSEGKINYGTGGFWFNNAKPAESWDQITEDTSKIIEQINASRAVIGLDPIDNGGSLDDEGSDEPIERYIVDFETLGSSDMFDGIPELEDEDPTEMTEEEALQKWLEAKGLSTLGVKVVSTSEEGLTKRVTFDIPTKAKEAFGEAYGLDLDENLGDGIDKVNGDGPDEPPTPPSGGLPPKSPAPSSPAAPALFREFDVPAGAFNLRTVEYEPEGRVDEASTDFTDAPNRLAVRFPLDTLVRAFTRSLIGDVDENVIEDIVDINDDGDGNLPDLSEVGDVLENNLPINVPRGERPRASGAGALEFNAGDEFVPAEALYNAVWLAGGDPNRVIANAYDAVNGNRNNLSKLLEAQGGVPTPEEEKLIVDMIDEIRQIDDVTSEEEKPVTNADTSVDEDDLGFPGGLIENVPVDFNNPDYHDMDLSPYISTILEPDELGYTDNPKYIAIMVKSSSDLIQQMKSGILDGTGAALVRFNDDSTSEVPVEAIRDALQYQGINTNDILFKLRDESNDMSNDEEVQSDLEIDNQEETAGVALDYPGPRKKGYSVENTTLDLNGNVIGEGSFITAVTDGKTGIILKIQDSPAYARIQFDDGTVVVRSANKIFAIANKDGSSPAKPSQDVAPVEIQREPSDITERLEAPATKAPLIARTGDVYGVNDVDSKIPDEIKDLTQKDVAQTTFSEWGTRDAEIAKAANTRVKLDELEKAMREVAAAREGRDREKLKEAQDRLNLIANDIYGGRQGISFGAEYYTLKLQAAQAFGYGTAEEILSGSKNAGLEVSFSVLNQSGVTVGSTRRTLTFSVTNNVDGTVSKVAIPSNNYMEITRDNNQKKGFASGYNRYMENWYIANGIEKVEVYAAVGEKYEGGFVWALNGFGWDPKRARIEIKDAINNLNRKAQTNYEIKWAEYLTDMAKNAYDPNTQTYDLSLAPTPMQIALAGWKEGSENWLGRKVMLDTGWHGVKNLIPSAREQVQAINYRKLKNAEKRVQSGQNKTNVSSKTLSYLSSNDFQVKHLELGKSVDMIRNVIRNNESLAVLTNADKVKLNNLVSAEMLDKNSKIPVDDIDKIRTALIAEYKADNATTDPFAEVGEVLTKFTLQQFTDKKDVQDAGFEIKALSTEEGKGVNSTWRITHKNSGQVFYVKNDAKTREYMEEYGSGGAATSLSEIEASVLLNSSGLLGTHFTRVSTTDENILIMSSAGATISTYTSPISARDMENYGLTTPAGGKFFNDDNTTTVNTLKSPEDVFRIHILDTILSNQDRHTGNWQVAFDTNDDKLLIFPIDNTYTYLDTSVDAGLVAMSQFLDNTYDSSLYKDTIPNIVLRAGKNRVYEIYKKEVQRIIDNIDNPITAPKENEMTFLISKWGSYDAFKDSIKQRLNALVEDGTEINTMLRDVLSYRGRRD